MVAAGAQCMSCDQFLEWCNERRDTMRPPPKPDGASGATLGDFFPAYLSLVSPEPVGVAVLQQLLAADEATLSYAVTDVRTLVVRGKTKALVLSDAQRRSIVKRLEGHDALVMSASVGRDGRWMASGGAESTGVRITS